MGAAAATLALPGSPIPKVLPAPIGLPFSSSVTPREVTRASEAVAELRRRDPAALNGLLDHALRIAGDLPFVPNGGKVSGHRLRSGETRAEIGLETLGRPKAGDEGVVLTIDRKGEVRVGVLDREMFPREVGRIGHVSSLVDKGSVSAVRFPTLARAIGVAAQAPRAADRPTARQVTAPADAGTSAPTAAPTAPQTAAQTPPLDRLAGIRDRESERFVAATFAPGYAARLGQFEAVRTQVQGLGSVPEGLPDRLGRAGAQLDKLRDRAARAGELAGLGKVLEAVRPQGIRQVTDSLGLVFDAAGLGTQLAKVHGEATAAATAFDTEMSAIHRDLARHVMPTISRAPPDVVDPNAAAKRKEAPLPPDTGVTLPPPSPPADPRASDPPPFPGKETDQREKPLVTPRETIDARDIGTNPFPPFREERPLSVPVPPETGDEGKAASGSSSPKETFEISPRADREPYVWPGVDIGSLLSRPYLSPGQREFLTYLDTPEGQRAFRGFVGLSRPWSDDPKDREAFIVEAALKVREMSLMGTGAKSQAELAFLLYGSREIGLRVYPELSVGSPNAVSTPRGYQELLSDPAFDLVVHMHTHPALGPEAINGRGERVNFGTPVTGFSQQDYRAFRYLHDSRRAKEQEAGLSPKILEFGNVTVLAGTVTLARFDARNEIQTLVIGAAGGVLEDAFSIVPMKTVPGLVRPPKGSSSRRKEAVEREQGFPNGIPGFERQTRFRD
jgi:hypothetical protein